MNRTLQMAAIATMAAAAQLGEETVCPGGPYDQLTFSEQYSDLLRLWDHHYGNQDGFFTDQELRDTWAYNFSEDRWAEILEEYEYKDMVKTPSFLVKHWIINEDYDGNSDGVTYEYLDMFVHAALFLKVPQSEIRRVFDTYGTFGTGLEDPDFLPVENLEQFFHDWMYGEFVFSEVPTSKYSRRYRQVLAYKGLSIGNQDGLLSVQEMYEDLRDRFPEESFEWMLDTYDSHCNSDSYFDYTSFNCPFDRPEFFVDNWILRDYSSDGLGLTYDELHTFVEQGLLEKDADKAVSYITDTYDDTEGDYITRWDVLRFFEEYIYAEHVVTGEWPNERIDSWPHDGEIATAIEMIGSDLANFPDGSPVDFSELVVRLSAMSGPEIKELLKRFSFDFEWWNDYNFIVRYLVGAFVADYEDLNAENLSSLLYFVGIYDFDMERVHQVIQEYSETDRDYLTLVEQMELIEDWFTGKLQFTESNDDHEEQLEALENLEELITQQMEDF